MEYLRPLWIRASQKLTEWTSAQGSVKNYFFYYQPPPYEHSETSIPLYHYTIPSATSVADFAKVGGADFCGNDNSRAELDSALLDFFWSVPPIQEREVVIVTPGWAGHYTVTENTAPTVLTINITPRSLLA
jgi:hypothetical protein